MKANPKFTLCSLQIIFILTPKLTTTESNCALLIVKVETTSCWIRLFCLDAGKICRSKLSTRSHNNALKKYGYHLFKVLDPDQARQIICLIFVLTVQ